MYMGTLGKAHEVLASPAHTVTRSAEARDVSVGQEIVDDLV